MTRGWTFQEAYCSRIILFVTEYGVFSLGLGPAIKCESLSVHDPDWWLASFGGRASSSFFDYFGVVQKYIKRKLSFPNEALNAFTGVRSLVTGISEYFGHPLHYFNESLLWQPTD